MRIVTVTISTCKIHFVNHKNIIYILYIMKNVIVITDEQHIGAINSWGYFLTFKNDAHMCTHICIPYSPR